MTSQEMENINHGESYEDLSGNSVQEDTEEEEEDIMAPSEITYLPLQQEKPKKKINRWDQKTIGKGKYRSWRKHKYVLLTCLHKSEREESSESACTEALRAQIFPILYAIFQQSRGRKEKYKIKNRTLRSLTKSCLYHNSEAQLRRTLNDADALLQKYCAN
ncbi:p33K [Bottlenose dolphin adenovirus 1]|uniref:p33K n=1 Tax=Bottlenose dolphin adenovirus 1 TaxID=1714377 RepID=A0A1X7MP08_9ADEN|nr:p33K [Bottlenose dolphin adenovirus 1]SMG83453.1 p33K [Bottlenose dolphin adenovirus 1]